MAKESIRIILESIANIHTLKQELNSASKFRIKNWINRRKLKALIDTVYKSIDSLYYDNWDIDYIRILEKNIILHYGELYPYMDEVSLTANPTIINSDINRFRTIYYNDYDKNRIFSLDITKSNNITIVIFEIPSGNSCILESALEFTDREKKAIDILKQKIIKLFKRYLNEELVNPEFIGRMNLNQSSNPLYRGKNKKN